MSSTRSPLDNWASGNGYDSFDEAIGTYLDQAVAAYKDVMSWGSRKSPKPSSPALTVTLASPNLDLHNRGCQSIHCTLDIVFTDERQTVKHPATDGQQPVEVPLPSIDDPSIGERNTGIDLHDCPSAVSAGAVTPASDLMVGDASDSSGRVSSSGFGRTVAEASSIADKTHDALGAIYSIQGVIDDDETYCIEQLDVAETALKSVLASLEELAA